MTEIKKNHSLRRIRLMKRAAVIRQNNGMDKREALVVAHQIDVLIRKMYLASVSFYYTKQDGSIRHAVGTLTGYVTSPFFKLLRQVIFTCSSGE